MFLTGCAIKDLAVSAMRDGVADFLEKPIDLDALDAAVLRAINRWSARTSENALRKDLAARVARQASDLDRLARDLSERNQQLSQARSSRELFLQMISHELRTPLHQIIMSLDLMEEAIAGGDREFSREIGDIIRNAAGRLDECAQRAVLVAEFRSGKARLAPSAFAAADLLQSVTDILSRRGVPTGRIHSVDDTGASRLYGDVGLLAKAVAYIADRLLGDLPEGRQLTVRVALESAEQCIDVEGDGPGVPAAEVRLGLEDVSLDGAGGQSLESPSLGLPLARYIVELHGGRMTAGCPRPGRARVAVRIPAR